MADVPEKAKKQNKDYIFAIGRRKESIARVRLYPLPKDNLVFGEYQVKKGDIVINGRHISSYFSSTTFKAQYEKPFKLTDTLNKYSITVRAEGGGQRSQLDAFVLGVARALTSMEPSFKDSLKKHGLLTRDQRERQRRKVGMGGKSRRKKQSPKR